MVKEAHKKEEKIVFELSEKDKENPLIKEGVIILKKRRKLMERLSKV